MQVRGESHRRSPGGRLPIFPAALLLALGFSGIAAAQASAAAISVPEACVVNTSTSAGSPMLVNGSGFTPGDTIDFATNKGAGFGTGVVGSDGTFQAQMTAPVLSKIGPAVATFAVTATDQTDGTTTATTSFHAANLAIATRPAQAKPGRKVTYTFSGFTPGAQVYAHYLHGRKVTATQRFGRASGPCGTLSARAKLYPAQQRYNSYKVQFDDVRRYSAKSLPHYITTLTVFKF